MFMCWLVGGCNIIVCCCEIKAKTESEKKMKERRKQRKQRVRKIMFAQDTQHVVARGAQQNNKVEFFFHVFRLYSCSICCL